ncbi:MAG: hypothetical protein RL748_804 [Pseudomonadota bacterium]|jgi:hypothetical protein
MSRVRIMKKITVLSMLAILLWMGGHALMQDDAGVAALQAAPISMPSIVPAPAAPSLARPAPSRPNVVARAPAERCETTLVSGGHTARAEWQARQGAQEDVVDICPSGKVMPHQLHCTPVEGAQGVMGYAAVKCVQHAACTVCGAALARMREVN